MRTNERTPASRLHRTELRAHVRVGRLANKVSGRNYIISCFLVIVRRTGSLRLSLLLTRRKIDLLSSGRLTSNSVIARESRSLVAGSLLFLSTTFYTSYSIFRPEMLSHSLSRQCSLSLFLFFFLNGNDLGIFRRSFVE